MSANNGAYDFTKDLEVLGKKMGNKAIRNAQKQALKPLAQEIKATAPVETGELRASIKSKVGPRRKGFVTTVVSISTADDNAHAGYREFGTREKPASPFIRPAAKRLAPEVVQIMVEKLDEALRDALQ